MNEENVVYFARLHSIIFFWPIILVLGAIVLSIEVPLFKDVGLLLSVFGIIWIFMTWITFHFSSLTIKKTQVILRTGMLVRTTIDMPLSKIETIDIRQSIIGSLFGYGTLIITGTGGTRHLINLLAKPLTCRRYIEQLMHD